MYPTPQESVFMMERHCADAGYVWNLAVEQFNWGARAGHALVGETAKAARSSPASL